jgi:hypothetical protein
MKPFLTLVTACGFGCLTAIAQPTAPVFSCNYTGAISPLSFGRLADGKNNAHAEQVVERILKPIGLTRNFSVMEYANTQNCFATVLHGKRYIIYDGAFMQRIENMTRTDWSAVSIMAHEIGHHLQGHTIDGQASRPGKELEADRFSGFVLHQLGASLEESLTAIWLLGNERATPTHPAKIDRVEAIQKGWQDAEDQYPNRLRVDLSGAVARVSSSRPAAPAAPVVNQPAKIIMANTGCLSGNCQNGAGVFVSATRERYEGEFAEGNKHGQGAQFYADGQLRYRGNFRNDQRNGVGAYYYPNGDRYVGNFTANTPGGHGTYYFADGDHFTGQFRDGKRNGKGVMHHADGSNEAGTYQDDELVE